MGAFDGDHVSNLGVTPLVMGGNDGIVHTTSRVSNAMGFSL